MGTTCALTDRDGEILDALAFRVKVLAVEQIAQRWWKDASDAAVTRRLRKLAEAGWVSPRRIASKGIAIPPSAPLLTIHAGDEEPDWPPVVRVARNRWNRTIRLIPAVVATSKLAKYLGGAVGGSRPSEGTHDLALAAVYLAYLRDRPASASTWRGERALLANGGTRKKIVPDAMVDKAGHVAIEIVGESYAPEKLRRFHRYCMESDWGYELW